MQELKTKILTDTWFSTNWDKYIQIMEKPAYKRAKGYYHNKRMRIEMPPLGNDHASDHTVVINAASLYAAVKNIPMNGKDNCTFRKAGFSDAQPDVAYYVGENVNAIPYGTSIIDLDIYPVPNLVIEVANTSLADDKGEKRLLYEDLGVDEYWIVDVQNAQMIAFKIIDGGSKRINESQVLPGLEFSLLNEAFRRTRETNQSEVIAWLLTQFQQRK
ncbi:MAG: Uma2 family endonuclease [Cyanobacteria bacterium P01_A01_bin.84]